MSQSPVTDGSPVRIRATDADRDHVASLIEASVVDGSLTPDEGGHREQAVRAAVHRDEFDALLVDLPLAQRPAPRPGGATAGPATGGRLRSRFARHRVLSIVVGVVIVLPCSAPAWPSVSISSTAAVTTAAVTTAAVTTAAGGTAAVTSGTTADAAPACALVA